MQWNTAIKRGKAILITDNNMNKSQKQYRGGKGNFRTGKSNLWQKMSEL